MRFASSASMMKISRLLSELRRSLAKIIVCPSGVKFGPTSCGPPTECVSCFARCRKDFSRKMILDEGYRRIEIMMYTPGWQTSNHVPVVIEQVSVCSFCGY